MGLAWIVPVDPVLLIINHDTYVELKPTLTIFRLCMKFGRTGQQYSIKLPE